MAKQLAKHVGVAKVKPTLKKKGQLHFSAEDKQSSLKAEPTYT